MKNCPADLSPELAAWMRVQMTIATSRATEPLRDEIRRLEEWTNGLFMVWVQVLPHLLKAHPGMALPLATSWAKVTEDYDRICVHGHPAKPGEPAEFLEARTVLYEVFSSLGLWRQDAPQASPRNRPQRRA